jgi:hypothetical protein
MDRTGRIVRIVGDPDPREVFCETETSMVLLNHAARLRREVARLERELAEAKRILEEHERQTAALA